MPPQPADAGEWIRARMEDLKLSVKTVSDVSGVSRQTIYTQMRNRHPPATDPPRGLAVALQVKPNWCDRLMLGDEPVEANTSGAGDLEARLYALKAAQTTDDQFAAAAFDGRKHTEADTPTQTFTRPHPPAEDGPHLDE